ncbi:MAG: hypothetical protein JSR49_17195 [Proteobacteria bacterium]|nr:hypothetical protein [Pseudomonadota bacterium]
MPRSKPQPVPTLPPDDEEPDDLPVEPDEGLVPPEGIEPDDEFERVINMPD